MFIIINIIITSFIIVLVGYTLWQMMKLPSNRPANYQKQEGEKVIVFAGDSITHGQIGENYVAMMSKRMSPQEYNFVNAGINSQLAWNLLQRIDEIIDCEPDIITILIGTNDANAATSEEKGKEYAKRMELPRLPDQEWYQESLQKIVTNLRESTQARIALISIPPIGEDPNHFAYKISSNYVKSIKEVANLTNVAYIPFHEKMVEYLEKNPGNPTYPLEKSVRAMTIACFKRYLLRNNWDSIGKSKGFQLHIDYLHLNTKSASMLTNLIEGFIKNN